MANETTYSPPARSGGNVGTGTIVLGIGAVGVVAYFAKDYLDRKRQESVLKYEQEQNKNFKGVTVAGKKLSNWYDLAGKPIDSVNLARVAADLNGALHPGWYIPTEQARAVRVFMQAPYGMVKNLEDVYFKMFSENLKQTLASKLSDVNWIKIKLAFDGKRYSWPGFDKL